jgi:hypothetical protein
MHLTTVYLPVQMNVRHADHCRVLFWNAWYRDVHAVHLLMPVNTKWECDYPMLAKVHLHPHFERTNLTYKALFHVSNSYPSPIRVVLNSDIIVRSAFKKECASFARKKRIIFRITRTNLACPINNSSVHFEKRRGTCLGGYEMYTGDGFVHFSTVMLHDAMSVPQNRMGAENLISCILASQNFRIMNACKQIQFLHMHCHPYRNYSRRHRIDRETHGGRKCSAFTAEKLDRTVDRTCFSGSLSSRGTNLYMATVPVQGPALTRILGGYD